MKFFLALITFSILPIICLAQIVVKGVVLDKASRAPLSYVNVYVPNQQNGMLTNSQGEFSIELEESRKDLIIFSRIGYESQQWNIQSEEINVFMEAQPPTFNAVFKLSQSIRDTLLGFNQEIMYHQVHCYKIVLSKLNRKLNPNFGNELAIKIKTKEGLEYRKINLVRFYIPDVGNPSTPFRVSFYNSENGHPGTPIESKPIIVQSDRADNWFEVDMSGYGLYPRASEFFVGMEWLFDASPKYWTKRKYKKNPKISSELKLYGSLSLFGQVLGVHEMSQVTVWQRSKFSEWKQYNIPRMPMIQVEMNIAE